MIDGGKKWREDRNDIPKTAGEFYIRKMSKSFTT